MEGHIDFGDAFTRRVKLLRGLDADLAWDSLKERLIYTPGAKQLSLLSDKFVMAIVSGGFMPIAEHVRDQLGFHHAYANNVL